MFKYKQDNALWPKSDTEVYGISDTHDTVIVMDMMCFVMTILNKDVHYKHMFEFWI